MVKIVTDSKTQTHLDPSKKISDIHKFVRALTGSDTTPCTWQTFRDSKTSKASAKIFHGSLDNVWSRLDAESRAGAGIFVTVQQTNLKGRESSDVTGLTACFIDIDNPNDTQKPFPLPYHLKVKSGRGYHYYWLLQPGEPVEDFRQAQKHLINWFDSDKAVHDLPRVMRLPGTIHQKGEPVPVELLEVHDLPKYTLEQIKAAYPLPQAPKRVIQYQPIDDVDYSEILTMTRSKVLAAAGACADGSRHTTLTSLIPMIRGRLNPNDAESLVLEFCSLTGLPEAEGLKILTWGNRHTFEPRLPKKQKLNNNRWRKPKNQTESKDDARTDLYEHLASILYSPDQQFHLVNVTTGLGKTSALANVFNEMHTKAWPQNDKGKDAKFLVLVDNHDLGSEFSDQLVFNPQVYKGRSKANCEEYDKIAGSETQASYCKAFCPVFKANMCRYYKDKQKAISQRVVIAAKQAYLYEGSDLSGFDVVIVDENITAHVYHQNVNFDRDDLILITQAIEHSDLEPSEAREAIKFIKGIQKDMTSTTPGTTVLKRKAPAIDASKIEKVIRLESGLFLKPRRLFSLFQGNHDMSIKVWSDKGKGRFESSFNVTSRKESLIEQLKGQTVINLDATPIESLLKEFKPVEFTRHVKQNLEIYQHSQHKFSRLMLGQDRYKGIANDKIRSILQRVTGDSVVFTFKDDRDDLAALLPDGTPIGIYGADGRGTNKFESVDCFILKGCYTPNIDAMAALARVAGVCKDKLIRDKQDAELLQVVGRARGVNRLKPAKIFILSNRPLKLDVKTKELDSWLNRTPVIESGLYIIPPSGQSSQPPMFEAQNGHVTRSHFWHQTTQTKTEDLIRQHVESCIVKHGFYVHDFAYGSGAFVQAYQSDLPFTERQYKRYIQQVLKPYEAGTVVIDEGITVKVWGSKQAAIAFMTDPLELEQAIAFVKKEYHQPLGLLRMTQTLGRLGIRPDIRTWLSNGDYTSDNWAILIQKIHDGVKP